MAERYIPALRFQALTALYDPLLALVLGVQLLDGFETTGDNVRGMLPRLIERAGFTDVRETHRRRTVFGTLALLRAIAPS